VEKLTIYRPRAVTDEQITGLYCLSERQQKKKESENYEPSTVCTYIGLQGPLFERHVFRYSTPPRKENRAILDVNASLFAMDLYTFYSAEGHSDATARVRLFR
jgi:hypothetical protein